MKHKVTYTSDIGPLGNGKCFTGMGKHSVISTVARLLKGGCPAAVRKLLFFFAFFAVAASVTAVVVNPIQGMFRARLLAHISQEVRKGIPPPFADIDASRSVVVEVFDADVVTSLHHRTVGAKLSCFTQAISGIVQATATLNLTALQVNREYFLILAAITSTQPASRFASGRILRDNYETPKSLADKVLEVRSDVSETTAATGFPGTECIGSSCLKVSAITFTQPSDATTAAISAIQYDKFPKPLSGKVLKIMRSAFRLACSHDVILLNRIAMVRASGGLHNFPQARFILAQSELYCKTQAVLYVTAS